MCLVALALRAHARWPVVLLSNRDEFFARPSAALGSWPEGWIGGRDLQAGGSWLAVHSLHARLALVTNVREPAAPVPGAASRGQLVVDALLDDARWQAGPDAQARQGFNLLQVDLRAATARWFSNRAPAGGAGGEAAAVGAALPAGVHGLSNAQLNTPWPKLRRLREALAAALAHEALAPDALLDALGDASPAPDAELPDTGVPRALERQLSSVFIRLHGEDGLARYGTRCSTLLRCDGHRLELHERRFAADGSVAGTTRLSRPL